MHRNKCDVYEDKIKHISGIKKYRFDKHMEMKSKASDKDTAAFFQKCRRRGPSKNKRRRRRRRRPVEKTSMWNCEEPVSMKNAMKIDCS